MATATAPTVGLVRCPKCLSVLQEVSDFHVFKCGACDTILVAKNKKAIAKSTSVLQETEVAVASKSVRLSEHGKSSISGLQEVLPSPSESWSSQESLENGENLSVEGKHNGRYKKDQNASSYSNGDDGSGRHMLDKSRSNEGQQNETELLQTESLDHYKTDQNTFGEGDGDDENGSNEGVNSESGTSNKIDSNPRGSRIGEHCGISSAGSADASEIVDFVSLCSESSGSHAYNGSISSYDGMDDHFSDQQLHSFRNSYKPANKKHYETQKNGKWHRDKPLEPVMQHRLPRSWPRLERDRYPSQAPSSQRAPSHGYGSAGPSHESRVEFPFDSALHPFDKAEYSEEENMKLLRMVHELQDQISRTYNLNGKTNVSASTDIPWRQKQYNTKHGIDNASSCCHPQAWKHSKQLPPPMFPQNGGFRRAGPGHSYNSYSSLPSSPQRYMESAFSNWVHETQSDEKRYRDHEIKRYLREKHHSVRQHIRPTASGAPFITCYYCIRPLHLPADFLLFKRRFHQLRCGACSKVLKFSLQKGAHIVPYEPVAAEPPPSKVEGCNDAVNARISGFASSNRGCMQADLFPYSNDYGHSFYRSCSRDGNPAKLHHNQTSNAYFQNMSSSSSKPMESFHSARSSRSKKVSSEIEGLRPRTGGSMLRRLTGHSSVSQVLKGRRPSISDTSSLHSGRKTQD